MYPWIGAFHPYKFLELVFNAWVNNTAQLIITII
jgi:hypothetical protein